MGTEIIKRQASVINRAEVKRRLLQFATDTRPYVGFTRVSEQTLIDIEAKVDAWIRGHVRSLPSRGKTL